MHFKTLSMTSWLIMAAGATALVIVVTSIIGKSNIANYFLDNGEHTIPTDLQKIKLNLKKCEQQRSEKLFHLEA